MGNDGEIIIHDLCKVLQWRHFKTLECDTAVKEYITFPVKLYMMCFDYLLKILLEEKQKEVDREKMKKTISQLIQDAAIKARKEVRSLIIRKMQSLRPN